MMVKTKLMVIGLVAVLASAGVYAATNFDDRGNDGGDGERTLTDLFGNEFTVGKVDRLVVDWGMAMRWVSYMGQDVIDSIVGARVAKQSLNTGDLPYSYLKFPDDYTYLSSINQNNYERIVELNPDLVVFCGWSNLSDDTITFIRNLKAVGIPTCLIKSISDVRDDDFERQLTLLGKVFGKEEQARRIVDGTAQYIRDLSKRLDGVSGEVNVYVGGVGFNGPHTFLGTNVEYNSFNYLDSKKVINVAKVVKPTASYGVMMEWDDIYNAQKDPGIDICMLDLDGFKLTAEDYRKNPAVYNQVNAIREVGFHYSIPHTHNGTIIENTLIGAYIIGSLAYPDAFKDTDVNRVAEEVWALFYGSDEAGDLIYNGISRYVTSLTGTEDAGVSGLLKTL